MYRYEKKYLINKIQIEILKNNLSAIMQNDQNIKDEYGYFIRSIYFDDYKNTNYFQVLDGYNERQKYRIRYYDYDTNYIFLEKKSKMNSLGIKKKGVLTKSRANKLINSTKFKIDDELINELQYKMECNLYKPIIIIDYLRIAYVYPLNDIRITIDYNISCSNEIDKFFDKDINSIPILEKDKAILEVKYNDFLPNIIKYALNERSLEEISFSKYANGRAMLEEIEGSI